MRLNPSSRRGAVALFATIVGGRLASAQHIPVPADRLESANVTTRMAAFYELAAAANFGREGKERTNLAARARAQDDLGRALISLLERENAFVAKAAPGSLSEDYGTGYYPDLFVTVARMKDPRSLNALMPVLGNGSVVSDAIASFGEQAIPSVIAVLNGPDESNQFSAVLILGKVAATAGELKLSSAALASVRSALLHAAEKSNSTDVREAAIQRLAPFSGADIRSVMQRIATTDSATGHRAGTPKRFILREAAASWLAAHP